MSEQNKRGEAGKGDAAKPAGKSESVRVTAGKSAGKPPEKTPPTQQPLGPVPPLFRKVDWLTAGAAALLVLIGYIYTLAPDVTLEDSGELAVGSYYAGVPHPPGYPVWTIYT